MFSVYTLCTDKKVDPKIIRYNLINTWTDLAEILDM